MLIKLHEALRQLPGPQEDGYAELFKHGTLSVGIYAPKRTDPQKPHTRDEAYMVISGNGEFVFGDQRMKFGTGDFLFAPAGIVHRFEGFTDDLLVWVIFYGPEGGECP